MLRSAVAIVSNLVMINKDFKNVMWDSVGKDDRFNLAIKTIHSLFAVFFVFSAVKYFPLAYVTGVSNIAPFFAVIFSAICLSEPPTC